VADAAPTSAAQSVSDRMTSPFAGTDETPRRKIGAAVSRREIACLTN
jgi:hypothetical protein